MQLRLESRAVHEAGHHVERLLNDVFHLAYDMRHETHVRFVEQCVVDAPKLGQHALDIAAPVDERAQHRLVTLVGNIGRTLYRRHFKH